MTKQDKLIKELEEEKAKIKKRLEDIEVHLLRNKDFPDVEVRYKMENW